MGSGRASVNKWMCVPKINISDPPSRRSTMPL